MNKWNNPSDIKDELINQMFGKPQNIEETVSNTELSNEEIKIIVNNLLTENLDSEIINDNVYQDLEIFTGNNNDPEQTIFNILDNTHTNIGSKKLKNMLLNPIKDITLLEKRQNIIKRLVKDQNIHQFIDQKLIQFKECEKDLLWLWKDITNDFNQILDMVYIRFNFFKSLNKSETFLRVFNYMKIIFSPVYGLLSPVILFIMPYLYIRFFTNYKISFGVYFRILKTTMFSNPLAIGPFASGGRSKISQYVSICMSILFYIQNVYNSIEVAKNTNKIINELHTKINLIRKILEISKDISEKTHYIFDKEKLNIEISKDIWDPLFTQTPNLFSNKGKILILFQDLLDTKSNLINTIKYIADIDAHNAIANLFNSTKETNAKYCFTEFSSNKVPTFKANNIWNPVLSPDKAITNDIKIGGSMPNNILITGPNAGGKSTIIKSITLAILMAQTFTISSAKECKLTPFSLINTYLNIPDHKGKESLFESEMKRAKNHITKLSSMSKTQLAFVVMDEIFSSTNPEEGMSGGYAIGEKLGQFQNSISIITTHYNYLTKLEETSLFKNYKIPIKRNENNEIIYPYLLKEGFSTQFIALELLKKKGFDTKLVDRAIEVCQEVSKLRSDRRFKKKKKSTTSDSSSSNEDLKQEIKKEIEEVSKKNETIIESEETHISDENIEQTAN